MGIAAYNRGSKAIRDQISRESHRSPEFEVMEIANSLDKYPDAGKPFADIEFAFSHGGCWATCPRTGFGFWYPTLYEAVRRWHVRLTGFRDGVFTAERTVRPCR